MIDARQHVVNPSGRYQVPPADRIGHAIHHSVTTISADATEAEEIAHIKGIDAYHNSLGWGGFGYHTATFPSGRSYQIGDWDGARAHVASRNHELVGSVAIGDFRTEPVTEAVLRGLAECVKAAREHFGRELEVKRHRDWALPQYPTECPALIDIQPILNYATTSETQEADVTQGQIDAKQSEQIGELQAENQAMKARMDALEEKLALLAQDVLKRGAVVKLDGDIRVV